MILFLFSMFLIEIKLNHFSSPFQLSSFVWILPMFPLQVDSIFFFCYSPPSPSLLSLYVCVHICICTHIQIYINTTYWVHFSCLCIYCFKADDIGLYIGQPIREDNFPSGSHELPVVLWVEVESHEIIPFMLRCPLILTLPGNGTLTSFNRWGNSESMVPIHNGMLLKVMTFVDKWLDLVKILLSEVTQT